MAVPRLDRLTVIAPSLEEGVEHVRAGLDLDIPYGGTHPETGTHNHVLRLGEEAYLEVIAVDPDCAGAVRAAMVRAGRSGRRAAQLGQRRSLARVGCADR